MAAPVLKAVADWRPLLVQGREGGMPAAALRRLVWAPLTTIKGFRAICEGKYDHLPEAAFYMVGTIEEAVEKGKKLAAEAA